jgi:hypothetical protein
MTEPVGQWRATYHPGDWVVLAGPTSVVVLEPADGEWSSLIGAIWQEVINSSSITQLAAALASFQLDTVPSFGAFFWTEDGMRSLVRGAVEVVDPASGQVVASGEGVQTWNETGLAGVSQVRIALPSPGDVAVDPAVASLELPLVVGAALASTVVLDCSEEAQVYSAQSQDGGSEDYEQPEVELGAPTEAYDVGAEFDAPTDPVGPDQDTQGPATEEGDTLDQSQVDQGEPDQDEPDHDGADERTFLENADTQFMPIPPVGAPVPAPIGAGSDDVTEQLDPEQRARLEDGDTQLMAPPSEVPAESMIMAVICEYGHTSPQNATVCRVCGTPIAPQGPQLVPRPALAILRSSDGSVVEVDRAVLIGRAPSADRSSARSPRLLTVPSPGHDISRTHVEVAPDGWQVAVTDLQSTNGTLIVPPGAGARHQLVAHDPQIVELGTVLELGDGITILVDFPQ